MSMYFNLIYSLLPLLISLLLIKKMGDIDKAMQYSTFLGFMLYCVKNFIEILIDSEGFGIVPRMEYALFLSIETTALQGFGVIKNIIFDKIPLTVAVFVLLFLVELICSSDILRYVNEAVDRFVTSRGCFLVVLLGLSLLFSIDDYLCCVGVSTVLAAVASAQGISRERVAYMICILSVSFCTLIQYSSWMPVIRSAIGGIVPLNMVIRMNIAGFLGIFIVAAEVLTNHPNMNVRNERKHSIKTISSETMKALCVLFVSLVVTALVLIVFNSTTDGTWSIAAAGFAGCIAVIVVGKQLSLIKIDKMPLGLKKAFINTASLFKTLFLVWLLKDICIELLGLSGFLMEMIESVKLPFVCIPAIVYLASAGFAFITGSAFGSFSLFIPLAIDLMRSSGAFLMSVAAAAALAGSFQSINRPGSDVIKLTSKVLKCDEKKLMKLQVRGMAQTIPIIFIGYMVISALGVHVKEVSVLLGTIPLIIINIFYYMQHKEGKRTIAVPILKRYKPIIPYSKRYSTFHQKCKDLEAPYEAIMTGMRKKNLTFHRINYTLKIL